MHSRYLVLAGALLAPSVLSQDFLSYKFESGCGTEVINYAVGASAFPGNGVLESNTSSQWTTGVFGGALEGGASTTLYNRVRSGWDPSVQNLTGDLTVAWFMRERTSPGGSLDYLLGANPGGHRLFTNGIAGRGLYQRVILAGGGNGINASITNDFYLPDTAADIQTLAAAGWVHVAIVVDSVAMTADWFVNGISVLQLTGVPGALINASGNYTVGYYSNASLYDFDEFTISQRAFLPAEIMALSLAPRSGEGDYDAAITSQCGNVTLDSVNGGPFLGNANYQLQVTTPAAGFFSIVFGTNRCTFASGTFQLPLMGSTLHPLLSGCWVLTDADLGSIGGGIAGMPATVPFPIPNNSGLLGVNAFSQALVLNGATFTIEASNGYALSLGF